MSKATQLADLNLVGRKQPAPQTPDQAPDGATRWRIDFHLTTQGLLHLGSGEDRQLNEGEIPDDPDRPAAEAPFAAMLVSDAHGRPHWPGASLKGVLRQRALEAGADPQWLTRVFGCTRKPTKEDKRSSLSGGAEFRAARWRCGSDVTLEVRTAIDRRTLTVAERKLFHQEVVPPGTQFDASIVLPWAAATDVAVLRQLLTDCSQDKPLRIGAHTRSGWGAVRVDKVQVHKTTHQSLQAWWDAPLGADGATRAWQDALVKGEAGLPQTPSSAGPGTTLKLNLQLQFEGPFAARDPAHPKAPGDGKPNSVPRERDGKPLLPATSFLGTLRSRAEQILRSLGSEVPQGHAAKPVRTGEQPDSDLASLLFGCAGWRGLLGATGDFIGRAGAQKMTQHMVALCRITGGGQDGAKFAFECWENPVLDGCLSFDQRRFEPLKQTPAGQAALGLLHLVLAELAYGDIGFGMARSKGWGWVKKNEQLLTRLAAEWWSVLAAVPPAGATEEPVHRQLLQALHQHCNYTPPEDHAGLMRDAVPHPASPGTAERPPTLFRGPGKVGAEFHNPYHFLPFAKLIPPSIGAGQHSHDRWHVGSHSGHLTVKLTTVTPLYIGGELVKSTHRMRPNRSKPFIYGAGAWRAIPGTSLRGMLSSLLEPMSGSALRVIDADRTLSVRALAEPGRGLPKHGEVGIQTDEEGDFLVVHDDDGKVWAIDPDAETMLHALADERWQAKGEKLDLNPANGSAKPKLYVPYKERKDKHGKFDPTRKGKIDLLPAIDCAGIDEYRAELRNPDPKKWGTRARLMPGQEVWFKLNSQNEHIAEIAWSGLYRKSHWLADMADPGPLSIKRLMLASGLADHLPLGLRGDTHQRYAAEWLLGAVEQRPKTGPSASGTATAFASKLLIGMAQSAVEPKTCAEITLKELSSPKPPSPSLYIRPREGTQRPVSKMDLIDKPADFQFQGSKRYLHAMRAAGQVTQLSRVGTEGGTSAPPWESQRHAGEVSDRQTTVTPIESGQIFSFTIRFTNLCTDELALLCAAIQPSEDFEHKLGMGRPIGLGSVKLKIDALQVINRDLRLRDGSQAHTDRAPAAWAALGMNSLKDRHPELWRALLLLGEPKRIKYPVHYPQVSGQAIETENYQWWKANDKSQALTPLDELQPTTAPCHSPAGTRRPS